MTEIPEHLLKRSRDRRAALGLGGDDAATPRRRGRAGRRAGHDRRATPRRGRRAERAGRPQGRGRSRAATAAEARPAVRRGGQVARRRSRSGRWSALSLMPVWLFMYVRSRHRAAGGRRPARSASAPRCTAAAPVCHGANGEGGVGRQFAEGEVAADVPAHRGPAALRLLRHRRVQPRRRRQLRQPRPRGRPAPGRLVRRDAGPGLDAGGDLTDDEILAVVCHERYTLGGADPAATSTSRSSRTGAPRSRRSTPPSRPGDDARRPRRRRPDERRRATRSRSSRSATRRPRARRPGVTATSGRHRPPDRASDDHDRRPRRRRRPGRRRRRLLAGPPRPRRHRRREEDVPAREDVRRRADAAGRQAARRHGPRATSWRSYHRYQGLRATGMGRELELEWPAHPVYPQLRLRRAPARARRVRRRQRRAAPGRRSSRATRPSHPLIERGFVRGADGRATADGATDRRAGRVHDRRRRRQQPLRPGPRHVPHPRVAVRHGDPHLLGVARSTPSRGSSRRSTSRTATATRCPATAGSSRSATAP